MLIFIFLTMIIGTLTFGACLPKKLINEMKKERPNYQEHWGEYRATQAITTVSATGERDYINNFEFITLSLRDKWEIVVKYKMKSPIKKEETWTGTYDVKDGKLIASINTEPRKEWNFADGVIGMELYFGMYNADIYRLNCRFEKVS